MSNIRQKVREASYRGIQNAIVAPVQKSRFKSKKKTSIKSDITPTDVESNNIVGDVGKLHSERAVTLSRPSHSVKQSSSSWWRYLAMQVIHTKIPSLNYLSMDKWVALCDKEHKRMRFIAFTRSRMNERSYVLGNDGNRNKSVKDLSTDSTAGTPQVLPRCVKVCEDSGADLSAPVKNRDGNDNIKVFYVNSEQDNDDKIVNPESDASAGITNNCKDNGLPFIVNLEGSSKEIVVGSPADFLENSSFSDSDSDEADEEACIHQINYILRNAIAEENNYEEGVGHHARKEDTDEAYRSIDFFGDQFLEAHEDKLHSKVDSTLAKPIRETCIEAMEITHSAQELICHMPKNIRRDATADMANGKEMDGTFPQNTPDNLNVTKLLNSNDVAVSMTLQEDIHRPRVWGYNLEMDSSDDSGDDAMNYIELHDLKQCGNDELVNSIIEFTKNNASSRSTDGLQCGDSEILDKVAIEERGHVLPCPERNRNDELPREMNCRPASRVWGYDMDIDDSSSEDCDSVDEEMSPPHIKQTVMDSPQRINPLVSVTCKSVDKIYDTGISSECRIEKGKDECDRSPGDTCEGHRVDCVIKPASLPVLTLSSGKHKSSIMINNCAMGSSNATVTRKKKRHVPMFDKPSELGHTYSSPKSREHPSTSMYRRIPPVVAKESKVGNSLRSNSTKQKSTTIISQKCTNYVMDSL